MVSFYVPMDERDAAHMRGLHRSEATVVMFDGPRQKLYTQEQVDALISERSKVRAGEPVVSDIEEKALVHYSMNRSSVDARHVMGTGEFGLGAICAADIYEAHLASGVSVEQVTNKIVDRMYLVLLDDDRGFVAKWTGKRWEQEEHYEDGAIRIVSIAFGPNQRVYDLPTTPRLSTLLKQ